MEHIGKVRSRYGLEHHGISKARRVHWNPPCPVLYEEILKRGEAMVAQGGPIIVRTGRHTGRSPNDKFIVKEPSSQDNVWWGPVNVPMAPEKFAGIKRRLFTYLQGKDLFVQDCYAGTVPEHQLPLRIITDTAWQSLFSRNMFIHYSDQEKMANHVPEFTIISAPGFKAIPEQDGTNSETVIVINFQEKLVIIGDSSYGGEIKKSIFSVLNYVLPLRGILSMHCSANVGPEGDVALFFGLSGTGKTSLSADPKRGLIGDDQHGWSDQGIFNFESGCYAKVIRLSPQAEPQIYATTSMFGTILENVVIDQETRRIDLDDDSITENTRGSYPIHFISNALLSGHGSHPSNIVMLTADAFGVMPPIARLTPAQAMYHFLSGYTAKVAGTEKGIDEPLATFSYCFGAPFMALHPTVYANLLGERITRHKVNCWLVNTGWTGGPYGVGHRMEIAYTRAMLNAALSGALEDVPYKPDLLFGIQVPTRCEGVPDEVLNPRNTWQDGDAYDAKARELAARFAGNFEPFTSHVSGEVRAAGPKIA